MSASIPIRKKMLIADDNSQITAILKAYAEKDGFSVFCAFDGDQALSLFELVKPDIILLDIMMPKKDGLAVCKIIRRASNTPIIMVTAKNEDFEKIMGLETGADDYIVKPFSPAEVMARVKAVLRRVSQDSTKPAAVFSFDNLIINLDEYTTTIDGQPVLLTKKETEILWLLAKNADRVFSREQLLDIVWGDEYSGDSRTVDTHIKRLRAKLDVPDHPAWSVKTIWGTGYKFETDNR